MANRMQIFAYKTPYNVYASHHKVEMPLQLNKDELVASGVAVEINGRTVVLAGTIYPSNDANAQGVIPYEYDLTDGDQAGALCIHGFIKCSALYVQPTDAAKTALKQIYFKGASSDTTPRLICDNPATKIVGNSISATVELRILNDRFKTSMSSTDLSLTSSVAGATGEMTFSNLKVADDGKRLRVGVECPKGATAATEIQVGAKATATVSGNAIDAVTVVNVVAAKKK